MNSLEQYKTWTFRTLKKSSIVSTSETYLPVRSKLSTWVANWLLLKNHSDNFELKYNIYNSFNFTVKLFTKNVAVETYGTILSAFSITISEDVIWIPLPLLSVQKLFAGLPLLQLSMSLRNKIYSALKSTVILFVIFCPWPFQRVITTLGVAKNEWYVEIIDRMVVFQNVCNYPIFFIACSSPHLGVSTTLCAIL